LNITACDFCLPLGHALRALTFQWEDHSL